MTILHTSIYKIVLKHNPFNCSLKFLVDPHSNQQSEVKQQPETKKLPEAQHKADSDQKGDVKQIADDRQQSTCCSQPDIGKKHRKKRKSAVEKNIDAALEQFKSVTKDDFERYAKF